MKFRKKPVVIEAVQFTEAVRDAALFDGQPLPDGVRLGASTLHPPTRKVWSASFFIETLEGRMEVCVGDWVITGKKQVDHLCNNRLCWNPQHLELVSHLTNQRRRSQRTISKP